MIEEILSANGIVFPKNFDIKTIASYLPYKIVNNIIYVSGQLARDVFKKDKNIADFDNSPLITGHFGVDINDIELGKYAARMCAIQILYVLKGAVYILDNVKSCIQLNVFVSSDKNFHDQHIVANGASDFMNEIFIKNPKHTRAAIGTSSLPLNSLVEVSGIFEV